ncbi:peptide ABC transporter substrate-binding protein [Sulfolobus sp. E5-1-F]|uniref:ABC transporter substrate-binding protein n=1 Tax=Saccharolobus sp. E5-1-F TaxID=2663019 RepID=UPI00129751F8|nr:ABC transporter substrate-binding protein [Sulfolobus sp. E5-1-F]QGA53770.1 peptide ABC transporter substrate-binding protein [Sulfolobus sp. E5-1-F]
MYSVLKIKSKKTISLLILVATIISPIFATAQSVSSSPASTAITIISYNGNDANGILAFEHGQIAFYAYAVPPSEYTSLPPGAKAYLLPSTYYDILVNPLNTTFGFNPFQFQEVRFALNYIVNRTYFVDSILHGYGIPAISLYAGEPDVIHLQPTLSKYANVHYNFTYANETIYKVLTAHGAQYINGKWYYDGKPITVYVFVRTDSTVRREYAEYFITQLQKLGFTVQQIQGNLQKEISVVYGSDPANTTWDILIEAWGGTYGYYDSSLAIGLYSTLGASDPYSSYYGLSMGTYNDTKYESPLLLKEANELDNLSLIIAQSQFTSAQEYYQLYNEIVNLGINMSVRIGLGMSLTPIYALSNINGIYPSFAQSTLLSFQTYYSITNGSYPNVTIGVRHLSQGSANPGAGFTDAYTDEIGSALFTPSSLTVPGSGYPVPFIYTYKIVNITPHAVVPVPSNALWWNPTTQQITKVPPNTTAQMAVIYNLAPLFNNDKWADGQNITLADIIYQYIIASEMSLNSSNPIYDSTASSVYAPALQTIKGFKVINSTAIEIWGNDWFFDPTEAVVSLFGSFNPLGYALAGGGYFPWQMYVGMKDVVAQGKAAWSEGAAQSKGVDWLNLVSPTDVGYIISALQNASATGYVPKSLQIVENLSGITLVTPQEAKAGYQAAINFMKTYGNGLIGDGPYILVAWNPSASPPYAKLIRNPYFHLVPPSNALASPTMYSVSLSVPSTVSPGQTLTGTVMGTPAGSTTAVPTPNAIVNIELLYPNGSIISGYKLMTNASGQFTFSVPSSLLPGSYLITVSAYSNTSILINPVTYTLVVLPSITTTTSTTTSTTTTSTSVSTSVSTTTITSVSTVVSTLLSTVVSSGSNIGYIAVIIVLIIIIIALAVLLFRRR